MIFVILQMVLPDGTTKEDELFDYVGVSKESNKTYEKKDKKDYDINL